MKTNRFIYVVLVSIFFLVSCAANLEVRKNQEEALRNLGEAYMRQGDYTSALRKLLEAEKLYSKDPHLQNNLGLVYRAKGKPGIAIDHFKKAVAIKPDYTPAKNNLGTAYLAQKKWDDAISCFKEISGDLLYATPHYPLSNLGWAYYNKKEFKLAEKYYQDALKIEPEFVIALRGLGMTYLKMGRISEAVTFLEKVIKLAPGSPIAIEAQKEIERLRIGELSDLGILQKPHNFPSFRRKPCLRQTSRARSTKCIFSSRKAQPSALSSIFKRLQVVWTLPGLDPGSTGVTTFYEFSTIYNLYRCSAAQAELSLV